MKYDVGIIGAGPAGCTAAIYLKQSGFNVALFEKKEFPRDVLCGEFLSAEVYQIIKDLNLLEKFRELNPNPINTFSLFNSDDNYISKELGFTGYGLSRGLFDNLLLQKVKDLNVDVFQPEEISTIHRQDDNFILNNKYIVKDLIAAYGKQNILDKKLERDFVKTTSRYNAVKFFLNINQLNNFNEESISIYLAAGIYCGINRIEDDKVTICFLEDVEINKSKNYRHLEGLIKSNIFIKDLFKNLNLEIINDIKIYGTGNIYFGIKDIYKDGIFMVGDASGIIAPLAGDGIAMAMQGGKLIAEVLNEKRTRNLSSDRTVDLYRTKRAKLFNSKINAAKKIQNLFLSSGLRNISIKIGKVFPSFITLLIKKTRSL